MGRRIIQLTPAGGFAAQTVASSVMVTTVVTLPAAGGVAAIAYWLTHAVVG